MHKTKWKYTITEGRISTINDESVLQQTVDIVKRKEARE